MANINMNINGTAKKQNNIWGSNPVIRNLKKATEENPSTEKASYKSIAMKCGVFLLMIVIGALLSMVLHNLSFEKIVFSENVTTNMPEIIVGVVSGITFTVLAIACVFVKKTLAFFGSVCCMSFGYLYGLMANLFQNYREAILLAIIVTLSIFAAVVFVYMSGLVKVTGKFKRAVSVMFSAVVISSLALLVCYFIPGLNGISMFVMQNPIAIICFSIIGIILATLSLLKDVNTINEIVENNMSSKYEWCAAFSLIFSLIWLFVEVVRLIIAIKES